jgi:putative colanic acid biosynthesis UDP-glucose lipid carrier transferase
MDARSGADAFLQSRTPAAAAKSVCKRIFDLVVSLFALILLAPLLLLVALAIRLETPGPILFRQSRTGMNGQTFTILKFRSMSHSASLGGLDQAQRCDPRVTRVGAVLRALSVDELPQLINVLKGDMSLVGPRPHAVEHDLRWSVYKPYELRFRVRPGLTGLAQVNGWRGELCGADDLARRIEHDLRYIEEWSIALDMIILCRTVPLLFRDPNAY